MNQKIDAMVSDLLDCSKPEKHEAETLELRVSDVRAVLERHMQEPTPRPMSEAPRDGTVILVFALSYGGVFEFPFAAKWSESAGEWVSVWGVNARTADRLCGWLPCPTYTGEALG